MGAGGGRGQPASYRGPCPIPTGSVVPFPPAGAAAPHGVRSPLGPTMEPRFPVDRHSVMSRPPPLTFAGLALLLLAPGPVRANEPVAAAPDETVAAPPEAASAPSPAGDRSEPPRVADTASWREPASSSRPAKRWSTSAELDSSSYRLSVSRGKLDLGMGFDAPAGAATRTARSADRGRADRSDAALAQHRLSQRHRRRAAGEPDRARQRRRRAAVVRPARRPGMEAGAVEHLHPRRPAPDRRRPGDDEGAQRPHRPLHEEQLLGLSGAWHLPQSAR